MNPVLAKWNEEREEAAMQAMLACCGARRWADAMVALRPMENILELSESADRVWATMHETDWLEAFAGHPRIGERKAALADAHSSTWAQQEQASTESAAGDVLAELAAGNAEYERRFGFTYIVCATGRSAEEMLGILTRRLKNDRAAELIEAAEQQRQILQIRLGKWLLQ